MESLTLKPVARIAGEIDLPGSKSISNRALLLAALAEGETRLSNLLASDDVRRMKEALVALGIGLDLSADGTRCRVIGRGGPFDAFGSEPLQLHLGNAGTAMRPLCAALCLGRGTFSLVGDPRMEERPIGDLVAALVPLGAHIDYLKNPGYPPLRITASGMRGGRVAVRGDISSQFLSSLLMAAPLFAGDSEIEVERELVSKPYLLLTLAMMARFGVEVARDGFSRFHVRGGQTYRAPGDLLVEGDASSASYFFAAAAIRGSATVRGLDRDSSQGDIRFLEVIERMGAVVIRHDHCVEVRSGPSPLRGLDIDCNHIPDAAMTLATLALFAEGKTAIRNIANWRVKETDRLAAMATELRKTGARVNEGPDFIEIEPPAVLRHATVDTYDDHRMAMCFSLLALADCGVTINDPGCVSKTFPDFFDRFASISH